MSTRPIAAADSAADAARDAAPGAVVGPARRLRGELTLPGDKSISHRALMLAALAAGESRIRGAGDGADVRSTAEICRALGATVERLEPDGTLGANVDYRVVWPGSDGLGEPAASTAATPGRVSGCSPGSSRDCPSGAFSTGTIHCGADPSLVSSNRCGRWAPRSTRVPTIPYRR